MSKVLIADSTTRWRYLWLLWLDLWKCWGVLSHRVEWILGASSYKELAQKATLFLHREGDKYILTITPMIASELTGPNSYKYTPVTWEVSEAESRWKSRWFRTKQLVTRTPTYIRTRHRWIYLCNWRIMGRLKAAVRTREALLRERTWIAPDPKNPTAYTGWRWNMPNGHRRRVVAAANNYGGFVVVDTRHFAVNMYAQCDAVGGVTVLRTFSYWQDPTADTECQGFIDNYGNYLKREEAMIMARNNKQFFGYLPVGPKERTLFSEHIH